ncbi:MAG: hypothetical protein ACI97P_000274 [Arcticibacterium sp.]
MKLIKIKLPELSWLSDRNLFQHLKIRDQVFDIDTSIFDYSIVRSLAVLLIRKVIGHSFNKGKSNCFEFDCIESENFQLTLTLIILKVQKLFWFRTLLQT